MKIQTTREGDFKTTSRVNIRIGNVVFRLSERHGELVINKRDEIEGKENSDVVWVRPYASNEILIK